MIEIDGSYLAAGGQILRTAIGLSALTKQPCKVVNIRSGRPNPGLQRQHLAGLRAVASLCNAKVGGDKLGSREILFAPREITAGSLTIDIESAGSISLVLQSLIVPAVGAPGKLIFNIKGGTSVSWSPGIEYFQEVFCRNIKNMGLEIESEILKYGFYPKGGGEVKVEVKPCKKLSPLNLAERGNVNRYDVRSIASKFLEKSNVAIRQIEGAKNIIPKFDCEYFEYVDTLSPGSSAHIHAHCDNSVLGATVLGERGKKAERVGEECAMLLQKQLDTNAALDRWMADQILPFMALATEHGPSEVSIAEITNHCLTNIWVIDKFLPVGFEVTGKKGEPGIIKCVRK